MVKSKRLILPTADMMSEATANESQQTATVSTITSMSSALVLESASLAKTLDIDGSELNANEAFIVDEHLASTLSAHAPAVIQLDTNHIDFGMCRPVTVSASANASLVAAPLNDTMEPSDQQDDSFNSLALNTGTGGSEHSINVFNNSGDKLMLVWHTRDDAAFSVVPNTCEIPPMKSYSLRVRFAPVSGNSRRLWSSTGVDSGLVWSTEDTEQLTISIS